MFSHIPGRKPIARLFGASLLTCSLAVAAAQAQELIAPLPPQGPAALGGFQPGVPENSATVDNPAMVPSAQKTEPLVHRIQAPNERMEMTVNSSRVLSL